MSVVVDFELGKLFAETVKFLDNDNKQANIYKAQVTKYYLYWLDMMNNKS